MRSIAGYVRRHHIGLLALFVALGGTAYAVQNAPKDSVVSKSIKDGQVKVKDVKLTKTKEFPALATLDPFSVETLDPLAVRVPNSGMVAAIRPVRDQEGQRSCGWNMCRQLESRRRGRLRGPVPKNLFYFRVHREEIVAGDRRDRGHRPV